MKTLACLAASLIGAGITYIYIKEQQRHPDNRTVASPRIIPPRRSLLNVPRHLYHAPFSLN